MSTVFSARSCYSGGPFVRTSHLGGDICLLQCDAGLAHARFFRGRSFVLPGACRGAHGFCPECPLSHHVLK